MAMADASRRILIRAGVVVTVDARMQVWRPGFLVVEGAQIAAAGPGPGPEGSFDEVVDAPDMIVMPGLVNGHAHSPSTLVKGLWSGLPLEIWRQHIRAAWRAYSDDALYVSAQLAAVEMLRTGVTAAMDHFYSGSPSPYMGAMNAVDGMADAGMRGALALTLSDQSYASTVGLDAADLNSGARSEVDRISAFETAVTIDGFPGFAAELRARRPQFVPVIGPSAPHRCSVELLSRCASMARALDVMVHIHVAETKGQAIQGRKAFGCSVVEHLDRVGLLNERLSMAHCVWLSDSDIALVAARGAVVVHNPASNGKLGSGRMRLERMLAAGVRVGLATDGSGSNDTQNVFEAMRFAGTIHNGSETDYRDWPSPAAILRAATQGSARAIAMADKAGMIAPGRLADLVFLTTESVHFTPLNDVVNQLVYCENGMSVRAAMVGGRWVMRDGRLTLIDEAALFARARRLRDDMDAAIREEFARTAALEPALREAWLKARSVGWCNATGVCLVDHD
jgi:5-methylthioadenosine/S-adenosylhomocysteine deaminase